METNNMNIRARFEEIWPVPEGVYWHDKHGCYLTYAENYDYADAACNEWNDRLDTFTRCQETTSIHLSLIDELVQEVESCHADLRKENWYVPRQSALLDRAKQIMEQKK